MTEARMSIEAGEIGVWENEGGALGRDMNDPAECPLCSTEPDTPRMKLLADTGCGQGRIKLNAPSLCAFDMEAI